MQTIVEELDPSRAEHLAVQTATAGPLHRTVRRRSLGEECSRHRRQERRLLFPELHLFFFAVGSQKCRCRLRPATVGPNVPAACLPRSSTGFARALPSQLTLKCPVRKRVHIGGLKLPTLLGHRSCAMRAPHWPPHFTCFTCTLSRWKAKSTMGVNQLKASRTNFRVIYEAAPVATSASFPSQLLAIQCRFQVRAHMSPQPANP